MNLQYLRLYAGEDRTFTLYARDPDNNVQDLTGKQVFWAFGLSPWNEWRQSAVIKTGTVVDATAGTFTVSLLPFDTQSLAGNFMHNAMTITDGSIRWLNNFGGEVAFNTNDGTRIRWVNDYHNSDHVVAQGVLNIRESVLQVLS